MLTCGNRKLGGQLIWGFALPSARADVCAGVTELCRHHCYALRLERIRPVLRRHCQGNLRLSQRPDFADRLYHFILAHDVKVIRVHSGGEFYGREYAGKWLDVLRRLPQVRFFCYSRAWREPAIKPVLEQMAECSNCRLWYSCDRQSGLPAVVPPRVRLAWLMTASDDLPPPQADLVFRVQHLRRQPQTRAAGVRVCPDEDGVRRKAAVTCERCHLCWRPLPEDPHARLPLPLVPPLS